MTRSVRMCYWCMLASRVCHSLGQDLDGEWGKRDSATAAGPQIARRVSSFIPLSPCFSHGGLFSRFHLSSLSLFWHYIYLFMSCLPSLFAPQFVFSSSTSPFTSFLSHQCPTHINPQTLRLYTI